MVEGIVALFDWARTHPGILTGVFAGSLLLIIVYAGLVFVAIGRMSPDYFVRPHPTPDTWWRQHPLLRLTTHVLKNTLGALALIMGILMLVLPGQGVLTILIGISLLDFPGKRRLEYRIISQGAVHRTIDRIRARAGRPPLVLPDP